METPFIGGQRDRSGSAGPSRRKCLICGSRALRALWVAFCCNTVFTVSQAFGSIISNSKALGADTGTMFVDSGTYLINIGAEYYRSKGESSERTAAAVDIAASAVSVVALALVTAFFLHDSITALQEEPSEGGSGDAGSGGADDSVNGAVVTLFTAANLIIDITMIGSILLRNRGGWWGLLTCKWHVRAAEVTSFQSVVPAGAPPTRAGQTGPTNAPQDGTVNVAHNGAADEEKITKTGDLNVVSALAHVLADTMRTVTEMSMGILVWADPKVDSEKADNIAAILVCTTILAIAMYIAYETIVLIREEIEIRSKPVPMLTTTSIVVNTR